MDFLLPALAFMTMGAVIVVALVSRHQTRKKMKKPDAETEKSSLAKDGPGPDPLR